jgi:hypothetical protein
MSLKDPRPAIPGTMPTGTPPGGPDFPQAMPHAAPIPGPPAGTDFRPAIHVAEPTVPSPAGSDPLGGHRTFDAQTSHAAEGQTSPQATTVPAPILGSPAGSKTSRSHNGCDTQSTSAAADDIPGGQTEHDPQTASAAGDLPLVPWPDHLSRDLAVAADTIDDIEQVRMAAENRLRQFTRGADELDADGGQRGFGWDIRSPAVVAQAALVARMKCDSEAVRQALADERPPKRKGCCLEHDAERSLTRALRAHPLGPWVRTVRGVGEKQGGRLIAAIGDPYARPELLLPDETWDPARPRTVSELWAYCGLKPGQKRKRGERANWSAAAKMRAWNVAGSMLKAGNREVYDKRKAHTEGRLHEGECARCGPKGKPAQPGTPWSDGHRHADALRVVSKEILKDLWREARRIHQETPVSGQDLPVTHGHGATDGASSAREAP